MFFVDLLCFAMPYTVETTDLISSKEKKSHIWRHLFSIHDTSPYHFNYSLSFNPVNVTFALLLEILKYIEPLVSKQAFMHLGRVHHL